MADEERHSRAEEATVITDRDQLARREAYNTLRQYLKIEEMVGYFLDPEHPFKLRPSHIASLHREALEGISASAGLSVSAVASTLLRRRLRCRSGSKNSVTMSTRGGVRSSLFIWPLMRCGD